MKALKLSIFTFIFLLALSTAAAKHPVEKLLDKYKGKKGISTVVISPFVLEMMGGDAASDIPEGIENMIIIRSEPEGRNSKKMDFYDEIINQINEDEYKSIMEVQEEDKKVKMLVRKKDGSVSEFLMLVTDDDESTVIWFSGENLDLGKVSKMSGGMNFNGIKGMNGKSESENDDEEKKDSEENKRKN